MKQNKALIFTVLLSCVLILFTSLSGAQQSSPERDEWKSLSQKVVEAYHKGHYGESFKWALKAYEYAENKFGPKDPDTLTSLNNLAALYQAQGRYGEAEPLYKKALNLRKEVLGQKHPDTLTSTLNYAGCLINLKKEKDALRLLKKMENLALRRADLMLYSTQKQRVRRQFMLSVSNFQDVVFTLTTQYKKPESSRLAADTIIRWKQMQAEEEAFMANLVHQPVAPEVRELAEKITQFRSRLTHAVHAPEETSDIQKSQSVLEELEALELKLAQISRGYKHHLEVYSADAEKVRWSLPEKSALLEFRIYRHADFKKWELGERHIAALLLHSGLEDNGLLFEDIGTVKEIAETWVSMRSTQNSQESDKYARELYTKLFGKFDDQIKNLKTLYIAPDGFLNLIAFDRLIIPEGGYWVERQPVRRILTGRDLLREQRDKASKKLIAFGGVDFDHYPEKGKPQHTEKTPKKEELVTASLRAGEELKGFNQLPASSDEIDKIASYYEQSHRVAPIIKNKTEASEAALKALTRAPRVLHLSTHGFYRSQKSYGPWETERPLVLSGLALSGANEGLKGKYGPSGEDGILYSLEILGLNLKGTELVSLSACKTGLGAVDYSEGVYGLVRAFRIAGARSVLMTLWSVNDSEAKDFMVEFYKKWLRERISPEKALRQTKRDYIKHKKEKLRKPEVWAPYVLVGG
jgi:CHAT domain-containing protein